MQFQCLISLQDTIAEVIGKMGSSPENKHIAGIAVVVDDSLKVIGVLTDGDIRRGLSHGACLSSTVCGVANTDPLTVDHKLPAAHMRRAAIDHARQRGAHVLKYDKLILVDENEVFIDVMLLSDILEPQLEEKRIAVYGLGFVGLTLACTLANVGLQVLGVERNPAIIAKLEQGIAPFYEKGLESMLSALTSTNPISYVESGANEGVDIHIVSVGSPLGASGEPDLSDVIAATDDIAGSLKLGDLVIFRSTVPVGTMRQVVLPRLQRSGLTCGIEFHLAFAPERTVEGNALEELRSLPQIVGGYNQASTTAVSQLFSRITPAVVEVGTLEEAELVKLINNTFRDLVFSFANEIAYVCDRYNVSAFDVIRAANEGYPRNQVPMPSPGVGGICLSKDPILFSCPVDRDGYMPVLGRASRSVNGQGASYVCSKLEAMARRTERAIDDMEILMVGLAFKGIPETSDIRASTALELVHRLPNPARVTVIDYVVSPGQVRELGCRPGGTSIAEALQGKHAVLFMNNHYLNSRFNVADALRECAQPLLFFDGWSLFDRREVERLGHVYATMGYITPELHA